MPVAPVAEATVVMIPLMPSTRRMTLFPRSAIYKLPLESTARPAGEFRLADVAGPLSPANAAVPFPATVLSVACTSVNA